MASEEFTEGSEQKRPNVQMGDPFMEKLLLEACLEAMATGAVLGIQDMGAAGLTCSTCEMGARGGLGLTVELDRVPQRETGMTSYEIMLSESQERMLLVADKERAVEVLDVFSKWGLDASIVGEVTEKPHMVHYAARRAGGGYSEPGADGRCSAVSPAGGDVEGSGADGSSGAGLLEELKKPRDYTADLKKLLASANICDKRWVFEQYDSMVQTNTVQGPGGEAGVMRIKGTGGWSTDSGLASLDNPPFANGAKDGAPDTVAGPRAWAGDGAGGNGRWTLSRSEAGRDACCGGGGTEGGLYGRDSGGGYELSELRESGEAGDYGAVVGGDRWDCGGL